MSNSTDPPNQFLLPFYSAIDIVVGPAVFCLTVVIKLPSCISIADGSFEMFLLSVVLPPSLVFCCQFNWMKRYGLKRVVHVSKDYNFDQRLQTL